MAKKNFRNTAHGSDKKMVDNLDLLAEFEDEKARILKKLRAAVKDGKSALEIYEMAQAEAAARAVTIALTSEDEAKALAGITDILNRVHGKAKESLTVTNKLESLSDQELDAALRAEEAEVAKRENRQH